MLLMDSFSPFERRKTQWLARTLRGVRILQQLSQLSSVLRNGTPTWKQAQVQAIMMQRRGRRV